MNKETPPAQPDHTKLLDQYERAGQKSSLADILRKKEEDRQKRLKIVSGKQEIRKIEEEDVDELFKDLA